MRWYMWLGIIVLVVGAIVYWQVNARLHAPLRPSGPEAQAELQAAIEQQNEAAFAQPAPETLDVAPVSAQNNVYFGDLHVHTSLSFDAYLFGTRLDPDAAYRIAKGEEAQVITGEKIQLTRPLDFVALTDHAEGFGMHEGCAQQTLTAAGEAFCADLNEPSIAFFLDLRASGEQRPPQKDLATLYRGDASYAQSLANATWQKVKDAADRHYEPGRFTTFAGYEYSPPLADTGKHHRNVIFRSSDTPANALSAYDAASEIDLWRQLEKDCQGDCQFLTIPHNPNKSWGLAFASETIDGVPYTADDWYLRARSEPIVEMFQIKGNSECSSAFGAADEGCDFEQFLPPCAAGQETLCIFPTSMVRDGLKIGLAMESELGINPLQFGMIGSSDTHNSNPGDVEEWDYRGASGYNTSPASRRLSGGRGGNRQSLQRNPGGLAAVWAEQNTREALFDAMKRREVYATSGTRIRLRVFAGFDLALANDEQVNLANLYARGVPMGGVLTARAGQTPEFFVWAMQDRLHAPLHKVQMIKGWVDGQGELQEQVFDIACGNRPISEVDDGCPVQAQVNLQDCSWQAGTGSAEVRVRWQDPDYDASLSAFYYVRVVQMPTCRWSTYDALRLGVPPPEGVPATVQEMAWASPIWIKP